MIVKKLFKVLLVVTFAIASSLSLGNVVGHAAKSSADFTDLKDLDAATKAKFDALISAGIFDGSTDSTFGLKDEMNRAQFAKVAALIMGLNVDTNQKKSSFSDVKSDDPTNGYALPYIEAILKAGITVGVGQGFFDPSGKVTNEQLATFLVRALGKDDEANGRTGSEDSTVSNWAKGYVGLALELGLLSKSSGSFGGKEPVAPDTLIYGSFQTKKQIETKQELEVISADFIADNKLLILLSVAVDPSSVDLSNIFINSVALDPSLDSFVLGADKKSIIITLHDGFQIDSTKTPLVAVEGLRTLFGNEVKEANESNPIPVTVTEPPSSGEQNPEQPNPNEGTPNPNEGSPNPNEGKPNPNEGSPNPNQGS